MAKIGCLKPFRGSYSSLSNVVLEDGEIAFTTDNKRIYMGNGVDTISSLNPFINAGTTNISSIGDGSITGAINTLNDKNKIYTHWFEKLTVTANERYMISNAKALFGIPSSVSSWSIIALNAGANGYYQGNYIDYNVRDVIYTQNDILSFIPSVSDTTYDIQLSLVLI